jgi:hypothetical protein
MKLNVIVSKKVGVINIASNSFVLEDLKAHICKKMNLDPTEYKSKILCGMSPSLELIRESR